MQAIDERLREYIADIIILKALQMSFSTNTIKVKGERNNAQIQLRP